VRKAFLIHSIASLAFALCAFASNAQVSGASGSTTNKTDSIERPVILVLGDSLSAEYGLQRGQGWVQLLANRLQQSGSNYTVVNASISGETTSGGRSRLPSLLKQHRPSIVIIELGGNDGLRGLPVARMQDNLAAMIRASQAAGARVLVAGIRIPPNYGREYTERFYRAFENVAKQHHTALVPFLLEGFSDSADFFQADRIHPSAQAQTRILQTVWPVLQPMVVADSSSKTAPKSRVKAPS
jgi:acyl-CoA thioesterase-1